jgi:outer membrane protein OmpA-like peptidoglycan-associated protein
MKRSTFLILAGVILHVIIPIPDCVQALMEKKHDFLPQYQNVFFVIDTSKSMHAEWSDRSPSRLIMAAHALGMFNSVMPPVPLWQYSVFASLVTIGDPRGPGLLVPLQPWNPKLIEPHYKILGYPSDYFSRISRLEDALQFCVDMARSVPGKTAIILFTDGGTVAQIPQKTAVEIKAQLGDRLAVFGIFFGDTEVGWRNLFEVCKLTGGYARNWREIQVKTSLKEFVWDILVKEIVFPYTEIFFQENSAQLLSSEAIKLEDVAKFLHLIPQYSMVIDGFSIPGSGQLETKQLARQRAAVVKEALVRTYKIRSDRINIRSIGSAYSPYAVENPETRMRNALATLYLRLPLRNSPYNEKQLYTYNQAASGDILNARERLSDMEWAWPARSQSLQKFHGRGRLYR